MNCKKFVYSVFSVFTSLYPKEYQQEYSEDMKSVFLDILDDFGNTGRLNVVRILLRECACLPICILREHFSFTGGGLMRSTRKIISIASLGFISFYLIQGVQSGTLIGFLNFSTSQPPQIILLLLLMDGILFGIFVGGAIGYILSVKHKTGMMAICGAAYILPKFLLNLDLFIPIPWMMNMGWAYFILYISSPISGFCFGLITGFYWKGWKSGIAFGLASSVLTTIGFWINRYAMFFLMDQGTRLARQCENIVPSTLAFFLLVGQ